MVRMAVILLLSAASAIGATNLWSAEWTNGTQTNALFMYEPHHYMELVAAVNERVIAANFSQSDFWNEGSTRPETNGLYQGRWNPMPDNRPAQIGSEYYTGSTNAFWKPSAAAHSAVVEKIVECSRYFAVSNFDATTWFQAPFSYFVGSDFDDRVPRWVYEMSESMDASPTSWIAISNPPIAFSINPTNYFGGLKFVPTNANESAYVMKAAVHASVTGSAIVIPTQTICRADFVPTSNGSTTAYITNVLESVENGAWEYDYIQVRLDPTNAASLSPSVTLYIYQGNDADVLTDAVGCGEDAISPDNANHGSAITNVLGIDRYSYGYSATPGIIATITNKYVTTANFFEGTVTTADTNGVFPLSIVAEYVNLKVYGSEDYGLRDGYTDWTPTWSELVYLRSVIRQMDCVPAQLALEVVGRHNYSSNIFSTNTSPGYADCASLPACPTAGSAVYTNLQTNAVVWDWAAGAWTNDPSADSGEISHASWNPIDNDGQAGVSVGVCQKIRSGSVGSGDYTATVAEASSSYSANKLQAAVKVPEMYLTAKTNGLGPIRVSGVKYWPKLTTQIAATPRSNDYVWTFGFYDDSYAAYFPIAETNVEQVIKDNSGDWYCLRLKGCYPTPETASDVHEYMYDVWADITGEENCWEEDYADIPSHWVGDPVIIEAGSYSGARRMTATALIFFEYAYP